MKKLILFIGLCWVFKISLAQSIGIGTNAPNSSAILHLNSTNKGLLMPTMTEAQRLAIVNPALGLVVYQTDGEYGFYFNISIFPSIPSWRQVSEGKSAFGPSIGNPDNIRSLFPGGVVIGAPSLHPSAALQVNSTTGGFLMPRMTTAQRLAIPAVINGLAVYDNSMERFYFQQGDRWRYILTDEFWLKTGDNIGNYGFNVGINNLAPVEKLDVGGYVRAHGAKFNMTDASPNVDLSYNNVDKAFIQLTGTGGENFRLGTVSSNETGKFIVRTNGVDRMYIDAAGNMSIGGTNFGNGYKLSVVGKIISEEVRVELRGDWPDYVFADNYQLPSLESVEQHIRENKHLPNIPSAAEVEKNGILLGDMQKKQMEKIEELTLYIIELNKRMEKLEKENDLLKAKNDKQ